MATAALLLIFSGSNGVHAQPVIGVHSPWPHATVVAIRAGLLGVAVGAKASVVTSHDLVPLNPIRTMPRIVQPARRRERPRCKADLDQARRVGEMTGTTFRTRATSGDRRCLVTIQAAAHPRQLIAGGQLEILNRAVALRAPDVTADVQGVIEPQVRSG